MILYPVMTHCYSNLRAWPNDGKYSCTVQLCIRHQITDLAGCTLTVHAHTPACMGGWASCIHALTKIQATEISSFLCTDLLEGVLTSVWISL